jgi:hypothetical protein
VFVNSEAEQIDNVVSAVKVGAFNIDGVFLVLGVTASTAIDSRVWFRLGVWHQLIFRL